MAAGQPMCRAWYERAGSYRPWHSHVEGCTCGANPHLPPDPGDHFTGCPVRDDLLSRAATGEPER